MYDVRYWHKADIASCTAHVRFWGNSGQARAPWNFTRCMSALSPEQAADALRYGIMAWRPEMKTTLTDVHPPPEDTRMQVLCVGDPTTQRGITLDDLFEAADRNYGTRRESRV